MPPLISPPPNIRPWRPIRVHVPAPPRAETNPNLERYEEAKAEWKDSTPAYRHKNPRPETWIPKTIVDTNYKLPIAEEKESRRLEYQEILEDIKDRIPPEYYEHFRQIYARPTNFGIEGPDPMAAVNGYKPGMFQHPRFMEKDHSKYHALPRKMFPEAEKMYKLQETQHVKDSLDILEDNGLDYEERMWLAKQKAAQKRLEDEKVMREEVFRTTHWIDWDSEENETAESVEEPTSSDHPNPLESMPSALEAPVRVVEDESQPVVNARQQVAVVPSNLAPSIAKQDFRSTIVNSAGGVALGSSLIALFYGGWRMLASLRRRGKGNSRNKAQNKREGTIARSWNVD
jgi:hypothetical protein